jgi:hypothetical protein
MLLFQGSQYAGPLQHRPKLDLPKTVRLPDPPAGWPLAIDRGLGVVRSSHEKVGDADQFHAWLRIRCGTGRPPDLGVQACKITRRLSSLYA